MLAGSSFKGYDSLPAVSKASIGLRGYLQKQHPGSRVTQGLTVLWLLGACLPVPQFPTLSFS